MDTEAIAQAQSYRPFRDTYEGVLDRIENLEARTKYPDDKGSAPSTPDADELRKEIETMQQEMKALQTQAKDIQRAILQGEPLPRFREITIRVETHCPECGSENIIIEDADEGEFFCRCYECGHRYEHLGF